MSAKKSKPVHDEIIRLYLLFHTYTEIAAKLGIDRGTVAAHVNEYEAERERAAVAQALAKQEAKQEKAKERSAARSKAKSRPQPDGPLETLPTSSSDAELRELRATVAALRSEFARQAAELESLRKRTPAGDPMVSKTVPVSSVEPQPALKTPPSPAPTAPRAPSDPTRPVPQPVPAGGQRGGQAASSLAATSARSSASLDTRTSAVPVQQFAERQLKLFD